MGSTDKLHPPFRNSARRQSLKLSADLIDHYHLGHVILHRLDHNRMLPEGSGDLHSPRTSYRRVRDIAVTANLI